MEESEKVLHLERCLCGAKNWTFRKEDRKYLRSFETGAGEGWRRSAGPIVLHGVREERNILHAVE